uniref:Ig-like domain-containing protein n=1 Tax=Oreochromis niloticus TaxID=8128 RepID=A0A669D2T8_ORENI
MATLRITSLLRGVLCACVLACTAEGELSVSSHTRDKQVLAESGNNVTLTCRAPNDKFIVVNWSRADLGEEYVLLYRDGHFDTTKQHPSLKKRVDLQDRQMKDGDVSLILENVTTADAGTYECHVFMEETRSWESICTSHLFLHEDQPGGRGHAGLIASASLCAVLVAFLIYRKHGQSQDSERPPAELQTDSITVR